MRTSASQFDLMVTFMEQHGDLSKPSSNARGKISTMQLWEQLTTILNSDGSGESRVTEKWKKVWSDFKNNSKKKAARLYKSVKGTGGGPAVFAKLTDLEQRVLNLIGVQVATGLAVEEAGFSQGGQINIPENLEQEVPIPSPPLSSLQILSSSQPWNEPGPSTRTHIAPPTGTPQESLTSPILTVVEIAMEDSEHNETQPRAASVQRRPVSSPPLAFTEVEVEGVMVTPTRPLSPSQDHIARPQPALVGQTPPQRALRGRPRRTPRRLIRPSRTDEAAQHFLQADEEWRKFKMLQHRDYTELRREQNRIRELEMRTQMEWQTVGLRALDLIEKLVNKYCRD